MSVATADRGGTLPPGLEMAVYEVAAPTHRRPACRGRLTATVSCNGRRPYAADGALDVRDQQRCTAPSRDRCRHQPQNWSEAQRVGINRANSIREYAEHHRQHRQQLRRAALTAPDRQLDVREPQVVQRDLPGHVPCPRRLDLAAETPAAAPVVAPVSTVIHRVHRIRSAITFAGSDGSPLSNPRTAARTRPPPTQSPPIDTSASLRPPAWQAARSARSPTAGRSA